MAATLKRAEILRRRRDFDRVMTTGRKLSGPALYLRFARQAETTGPVASPRRVAFLVSRRVAGAVDRNRLRRRLREVYRNGKSSFPAGFDYLFQCGPGSGVLTFERLRESVIELAARMPADA